MRCWFAPALLLLSSLASSHDGDEKGLPYAHQSEIESYARFIVAQRIRRGELPSSWEKAALKQVHQADYEFQREWVVAFSNGAESKGPRELFVFFDLQGSYLGSNFTGQ